MSMKVAPLLAASFVLLSFSEAKKPYKMEMLHISRYTGNEPLVSTDCRLGARIAAQTANNRTDILSSYDIEVYDLDERPVAVLNTVNGFMNYSNYFDNNKPKLIERGMYPMPVIVGSWLSNGCGALGNFIQHLGYISISTTCQATFLRNRKRYPNSFFSLPTGPGRTFGLMKLARELWGIQRLGIGSTTASFNDFQLGQYIYALAVTAGLEVPWYDSFLQFDRERALAVIERDIRLIVAVISLPQDTVVMFCELYKVGYRGPRYRFVMPDVSLPDPVTYPSGSIPKGCTRQMIAEQVQITFYYTIGLDDHTNPTNGTSEFGHSRQNFEDLFVAVKNGSAPSPIDYERRFLCYDTAMQTIFTLDKAERSLQNFENLTLRDFQTDKRNTVAAYIHREALAIDIRGLHTDRIRFDSAGDVFATTSFITHYTPATRFRRIYLMSRLDSQVESFDSISVKQVAPFDWQTVDGLPPRDRRYFATITLQPGLGAVIATSCIACAISLLQTVGIFFIFFKRRKSQIGMAWLKILGLFTCCFVLNAAAVLFTVETNISWGRILEIVRLSLLVVGLSITNGLSAFEPMTLYYRGKRTTVVVSKEQASNAHASKEQATGSLVSKEQASTSLSTKEQASSSFVSSSKTLISAESQLQSRPVSRVDKSKTQKTLPKFNRDIGQWSVLKILGVFLAANVYVLTIWLILDGGLVCQSIQPANIKAAYDEKTDTFFEYRIVTCFSPVQHSAWVLTLAVMHIAALFGGGLSLFKLKQRYGKNTPPGYNLTALSVINSMALSILAIFIVIILNDQILEQRIAVTALTLISSVLHTITWLLPAFRHGIEVDASLSQI